MLTSALELLNALDTRWSLQQVVKPELWVEALVSDLARATEEEQPVILALHADMRGWTDEEKSRFAMYVGTPAFEKSLGWLAPPVAARYGQQAGVPLMMERMLTWEGQRSMSPDVDYVDHDDPATLEVRDVTPEYSRCAGQWLSSQLATPDAATVAYRWRVVFEAADNDFPGTLSDLVEVATAITAA